MTVSEFITAYREAFGEKPSLPLVFWYSDTPVAVTDKIEGCFFKGVWRARQGQAVALSADVISCGGGKLYTGFGPLPERVPLFVSYTEHYKRTHEDVVAYVESLELEPAKGRYLNFARIDQVDSFEGIEGMMFYATPDMLAGLHMWACFDNREEHAVSANFGSGCSSVVSLAVRENRRGGRRCFLGAFDPSVRPYFRADELSFVIPASRLEEMLSTMSESCLYGTRAWGVVRKRVNK